MKRRACLMLLAAISAGHPATVFGATPDPADWVAWKAAFLSADGRIIDHLQSGASHSEGQGYGLFLAEWFGDAEAFAHIFAWTEAHLAVRQDPLLAWKWQSAPAPQIADYNNASDGDLFYAWALARGATRFGLPEGASRAQGIARFLSTACLHPDPRHHGRLLLLPAAEGFVEAGSVTVNPAYIMPLALRELGLATQTPALLQAAADGEALLAEIAETSLIPDWITVTARGWTPSVRHRRENGYDALRCQLFLIWSGRADHPAVLNAAATYKIYTTQDETPVVFDLAKRAPRIKSRYDGYAAIDALTRCADALPLFTTDQPYYPATLHLFSQIALHVAANSCLG